jgi:hypothetical protein
MSLGPKNAGEDGVEGSDIEVPRFPIAENMFDTFLHLSRRLVREGQRQYVKGIYTLCQQVSDAGSKYFGFSAAGTGYNHQWSVDGKNGIFLPFIQSLQIILHK